MHLSEIAAEEGGIDTSGKDLIPTVDTMLDGSVVMNDAAKALFDPLCPCGARKSVHRAVCQMYVGGAPKEPLLICPKSTFRSE